MSAADLSRSFAATLTPAGRGAVAVIGICGPLAESALARQFQRGEKSRGLTSVAPGHPEKFDVIPPLRQILYGIWQPRDQAVGLCDTAARPCEDVVLTRFETHWELGCHGGAIAAPAILRDLAAAGIETISWHEWLALTSKNRLQASAAVALAAAQSPAAALALLQAAPLTEQALRELIAAYCDAPRGVRCIHPRTPRTYW